MAMDLTASAQNLAKAEFQVARRAKENANVNQDVNGKELLHLVNEQSETKETQNIKYN